MRYRVLVVLALTLGILATVGCSQAAAPAPTQAPAAKAAEPTKASAAAPAVAPTAAAAKPDYPAKGKTITMYVTSAAGTATDISARTIQPFLEKEFGVAMPIINKPGSSGLVGNTDFVQNAKPDGYSVLWLSLPVHATHYLDPALKATYSRKDLQLMTNYSEDVAVISVKNDSPYKTLKDLVDAAKAAPGKITVTASGPMTNGHNVMVQLEMVAGAKFAPLFITDAGQARAALLGGHADAEGNTLSEVVSAARNKDIRVLAVFGPEESKFLPGVKTAEAQGYKANVRWTAGVVAPKGTPPEIVSAWSKVMKKITSDPEHLKLLEQQSFSARYMDTPEFETYLTQVEDTMKTVIQAARQQ